MHFCSGTNIEQSKDHLAKGHLLDAAFCLGRAEELLIYCTNSDKNPYPDRTLIQLSEVKGLKYQIWNQKSKA